jgi:phosphatidate cytidylyltransferase
MLSTRIITAIVLIAAVLAALFLLPPRAFGIAALIVMLLAAHEWATLTGLRNGAWLAFIAVLLLLGLYLLFAATTGFERGWPRPVVLSVCGLAAAFWLLVAPAWVIRRWAVRSRAAMAVIGWIVLLATFVALVELQTRSPWLVLAAMAIVWIADTAAYFTGRAFGKRKLAPAVSPGKTWEGVYGALAAVALYALALIPLARDAGFAPEAQPLFVVGWLVLVLLVAGVSIVGDLFESLLKRTAGVKDSSHLLPGHGGVLDRIDALLAAMPLLAIGAVTWLARPT